MFLGGVTVRSCEASAVLRTPVLGLDRSERRGDVAIRVAWPVDSRNRRCGRCDVEKGPADVVVGKGYARRRTGSRPAGSGWRVRPGGERAPTVTGYFRAVAEDPTRPFPVPDAQATAAAPMAKPEQTGMCGVPVWLGDLDSNQD